MRDERGVAAVIVMLSMVAVFAIGAVVVDVAALFQERRVLQNGADAAAIAIAQQCSAGSCGNPTATASQYADANANDGATSIEELCGSGITGVSSCSSPPAVPSGAKYVRVSTKTETANGGTQVKFTFAHLLGFAGATVHARAVVGWGGPASLTSELPMTMSECEFDKYTNDNTNLKPPPPYNTSGYPSPEAVIYLHDTTGANPCPDGPAGSDLPGGFGWLDTGESGCHATSDTTDWYADDPGRSPPTTCTAAMMAALVGTVVQIPIFDQTNGLNGNNGEYHMTGFASFYVTGYSIEGQYKRASLVTGQFPCRGQTSCVSGFFVNSPKPVSGTLGGPSMGVVVLQIIQ